MSEITPENVQEKLNLFQQMQQQVQALSQQASQIDMSTLEDAGLTFSGADLEANKAVAITSGDGLPSSQSEKCSSTNLVENEALR